jgi:hypothetical protein
MPMPNFFIIGAAKSGSTSLYHYLRQHPQIYMSPLKEPKFFALANERLDFNGPGDQENVSRAITSMDAYQALFREVSDELLVGEASVLYLYSQKALHRIRQYCPNAKLIAILRNPVDRAYSNFLALRQRNEEPIVDFAQALQQEEIRIRNNWHPRWHYKQRGFYYAQLKLYFDAFSRSQIGIYLYDDLCANPGKLLRDIFRFLCVDETFIPDISIKHNMAHRIPRSKILHAFLSRSNVIKTVLKLFFPVGLRQRLRINLENKNLVKPSLPTKIRRELTQTYQKDILKLQDLIQRDLSKWLK